MNVWAEKLGGFAEVPEVFGVVLSSLPDEPPNLPGFVALCRGAMLRMRDGQQRIAHKLTPEEEEHNRVMAERALAAAKPSKGIDGLEWARKPRSRMAFAEVLKLANPSGPEESCDMRFRKILAELTAAGVSDGQSLLKVWTGNEWAAA